MPNAAGADADDGDDACRARARDPTAAVLSRQRPAAIALDAKAEAALAQIAACRRSDRRLLSPADLGATVRDALALALREVTTLNGGSRTSAKSGAAHTASQTAADVPTADGAAETGAEADADDADAGVGGAGVSLGSAAHTIATVKRAGGVGDDGCTARRRRLPRVVVTAAHLHAAFEKTEPSISRDVLAHFEAVRSAFEGGKAPSSAANAPPLPALPPSSSMAPGGRANDGPPRAALR